MPAKFEDKHEVPVVTELPAEKPMYTIQRKQLSIAADQHELDTCPPATEVQSGEWDQSRVLQQTFNQPYEAALEFLDGGKDQVAETALVQHEPEPEPSLVSSQTVLSDASGSASSSRMEELKARREHIRVGKERLLKLQELDEMEAAVQREIQEEQKRSEKLSPINNT